MQKQGATRTSCTQKFPKIDGMYAAVAACTCTRACADTCGDTLNCKLTPKCGYKLPAGSCTTCTEGSCCAETFDCTADGDCFLCLKNGDDDPGCATNANRKKLATCVATSCKAECEGSGLDTGADPPAEEGDGTGEGGGGGGGGTTTTTTEGCAVTNAMGSRSSGGELALGVLALTLLAARRRRR
jgi:MYXO-CTERM domain-containing protein